MSESLDRIARWIQAQDEELLYAPDGATVDIGDIAAEDLVWVDERPLPNLDAALLATREVTIEDVRRWFAIPAHLLEVGHG